MSIFQSLIKKEVLHLLRDSRTTLVVLVIPAVLLLLFGFAISTEVNNVRIVAVAEQHTDETRQMIDRFRANSYFTFEGMVPYHEVENLLRKGKADAAVIFRVEDGKLTHQVIVDASNTTLAQTATAYIESVMGQGTNVPVVDGNHEPAAGISRASTDNYLRQIGALFPVVVPHTGIDPAAGLYRAGASLLHRHHTCRMAQHPLHHLGAGLGAAYIHDSCHAGLRPVGFRRDVYDSGRPAVRHDFSGGKHAFSPAMVLVHHPGPLVHLCHACPDDPAASRRLRPDRSAGLVGHDNGCAGLGHQEV